MSDATTQNLDGIAIIGMAGRFPGARNIRQFWENLCGGVESVTFLEDHEVESPLGLSSSSTSKHVNAAAILDDIEQFDAAFFGFNPREAEIMDPQHRLFLEAAWEALEDAGYDPARYTGAIGVFASTQMSSYLIANLLPNRPLVESMGALALRIANDRDFLPTRVSYKLNLRGTSVTVATACSSSLVATHLACQSLLDYQNDIVLAGGVTINVPQRSGYAYQEGGLFSPDGHCRAFDADAQGTFSGNGLGLVVLKRLEDAVEDGDQIYAVIRGSATNNDGSSKVGYTAPSVDGQAGVILAAQIVADVEPETIGYIETHGAGTPLGDPIEVAALTQAFRASTDATGFCAIGSVKTNVGHLDSAAGITGLIKTALALKHRQIPPSLNCSNPNPAINFPSTPFYVNTELRPWQANGTPRRAGVSSFGVGGTNAHVVLEEAPPIPPSDAARPWQLLLLSAKTATALDSATDRLVAYLRENPAANLADIAYTLQMGRRAFDHRQMLVCRDARDALAALESRDSARIVRRASAANLAPIAFMFAGLGDHYSEMGLELYQTEQVFRETIDQCAALLKPELGLDLRDVLYPRGTSAQPELPDAPTQTFDISRLLNREPAQTEPNNLPLNRTDLAQPILFALEYALAQQWIAWGVQPQALIGHSLGEYVAATIAGVFALPDALRVVATRARLIQSLPGGAMLTVMLSEQELQPYLSQDVALAAVNSPFVCVVAGSHAAIDALEQRLASDGIGCRRLATSHAFHSQMMEPILERFVGFMRGVRLQAPEIPFVSNVTGDWITAAQATDPRYWARHLRQTVRFADGARLLWSEPGRILIEVGPGQSLSSMARQQPKQRKTDQRLALPTLRAATDPTPDRAITLNTFGRLWLAGVPINWAVLYRDERRMRVALPTYPFERQRYWLDPPIADQPWSSAPAQQTTAASAPEAAAIVSVHSRPELSSDYVGPRNETEQMIVAMWEELLGIAPIGMYDNFFELGGHSLLATRLIGRLHEQLHVELPLQSLFVAPTVAQLAEQIAAATAPALDPQAIPLAPRDQPLPLSFAQQRLWLLHQLDPQDVSYNMPFAVRVSGPLDVAVFARCIQTIVDRHETLRTTFTQSVPAGGSAQDEQPYQQIVPALAIPLLEHDLTHVAAPDQQAALQPIIVEAARQPFDLSAGPLIRIGLVRLSADEHVVYLVMHHIISDGWSMGVFVRELLALYELLRAGQPYDQAPQLPQLTVQYADYTLWQRSWLRDERLAALLNYWTQRFDPLPPVLDLPTDRPRPPIQTHAGRHYPVVLSAALTGDLKQFSQREGVTLYMTLLAAFLVLLQRWSGQHDLVVGSPIAGRTRRELEALIGFFVNTLALRADLSGSLAFRDLLGRVRATTLDAYAHQDLPFERLIEELRLARDVSHTPLVQVMFSLQNTPFTVLESTELTMTAVEFDQEVAQFDLVLALTERDDQLMGAFEYNTDLFDAATIERLAERFQIVLKGMLERPDSLISDLPIISAAERRQVLIDWNRTAAEYPRDAAVHQLIEAQAERTPNAAAIVFQDQSLTYAELNARAHQLAHSLRARGVGPEVPVAVFMQRTPEMIVGMLAILKAGGAYVPLDPAYPAQRLAFMLADTEVPVVLTQQSLVALLPEHTAQVICVDLIDTTGAGEILPLPGSVQSSSLAYIIYTSGSTGTPKGVQVTHAGLLNLIHWHLQTQAITAADRASHVAGLSFDAAVVEIWPSLVAGASLYLVDDAIKAMPEELRDWLREHEITRAFVPTPLAEALLDLPLTDLPALKTLFIGGEQLRRYPDRDLSFPLVNLYGPTETTVVASYAQIQHQPEPAALPPIGRPIANTQAYILDRRFNPVPIGVMGELYIGGAGVARGYLNRRDLTAEKFIPDPFSSEPGARLYSTGDLARYRANGELEFLGRIDQQIKLRGFRIELGEIEAALMQHEAVREAAVIVRDERLVAYVVQNPEPRTQNQDVESDGSRSPSRNAVLGSADLRAFLQDKLPDHMIPAAFVPLDALPKTPSGKIDRKALPAPDLERSSQYAAFVAPRTPTEELLAGIWTQLLNVQPIGVHDSFFELGGHSLLATRIVSRLRETFQIELPLRALFEAPTLATLAEQIDMARRESKGADSAHKVPPLTPQPRPDTLPLSFAQQRLWLLDQINPGSAGYNISVAVRLRGPLDEAALEASFTAIIARHEALRTTFVRTHDGQARQVIGTAGPHSLTRIDLRHLDATMREAEVQARAQSDAARPFNLSDGQLLRTTLLQLDASEHVLLLTMHHIIADGWSMGVLVGDLAAHYRAILSRNTQPQPSPDEQLLPLAVQYADYTLWQRSWLRDARLAALLNYWTQRFDPLPPVLDLPTDRPRPPIQTYQGAIEPFQIDAPLLKALLHLGHRHSATLYMTLLAAFLVLLQRWSGQHDLVVGSPIAGRTRRELEALIGFFVNTLALRADLSGNPTFRDLLGRVRATTLDAYAHQDLPFELLMDTLQPERDLSRQPLVQVMFVLQNTPLPALQVDDLHLEPIPFDPGIAKFDLTLNLVETSNGLDGSFEYNTDLFDGATIRRMAAQMQTLLHSIVAEPEQPIGMLPLLPIAEREQVLAWSGTPATDAAAECVHDLIAAQAAATPNEIAVIGDDASLSYAELDRRSNQLAQYLQALGVGPEVCVSIYMEPSPEVIVGLLGVLKAGGAYVPLDLAYPRERLTYMLKDSRSRVLLTQERLLAALPQHGAATVCLDRDWAMIARHDPAARSSLVQPAQIAYVIYTSGSTGVPKGVMVSHRGLMSYLQWAVDVYRLDDGAGAPVHSSLGFDLTITSLFPPLLCGRSVWLLAQASHVESLTHALNAGPGYSLVKATPAHLDLLRHMLAAETLAAQTRALVIGGEALRYDSIDFWRRHTPGTRLINEYGPTEAVVGCCIYEVAPDDPRTGMVPIGRPTASTQIYILDPDGQPAPIGVPGEIYLGGVQLARGYLNRPDLTAEKFLPDPFSAKPGERLYRTGDLARFRSDGTIEYLGRIDHQIKLHGYRVELGEIESVLRQHEAVREAVVLLRDERLVAYVVAPGPHPPAPSPTSAGEGEPAPSLLSSSPAGAGEGVMRSIGGEGLRAFLQERLPSYMVPSDLVLLESLPLTAHGKIDYRALPAPSGARPELDSTFVAPRTPTEQTLAAIWQAALGREQVGIHDNFFALGGDSIRSIAVVAAAQTAGLMLTVQQIFQHQTIAALAPLAQTGRAETQTQPAPFSLISAADRERMTAAVEDAYPLTQLQLGMLFHSQYDPEARVYHSIHSYQLHGPLDPESFAQAAQELVDRHPALRTAFELERYQQPLQLVYRHVPVQVIQADLQELDGPQQEAALDAWLDQEREQAFNWREPQLARFYLHRRAADRFQFSLSFHHAILDGWSVVLLLTELFQRYMARLQGTPLMVEPLQTGVRSFVALERAALESAEHQAFWAHALRDRPTLTLPLAAMPQPYAGPRQTEIEPEIAEALKRLAAELGVPLRSVLLTAHLAVLRLISGQRRVITGVVTNGRPETPDGEQILGLFLNSVPFQLAIDRRSWRDLIRATFAAEQQMLPFRRYPVAQMQRDVGGQPLFDVLFNFVHFHAYQQIQQVPGLTALDQRSFGKTNFTLDVAFILSTDTSTIGLELDYDARLGAEQAERLAQLYLQMLRAIAAQPDRGYSAAALLSPTGHEQPGATVRAAQPEHCYVHEMIGAQAARTPQAIALICDGESLSYAGLERRANQLARLLQRSGVGPETCVGVCLHPSIELVIALLAVLKAGGTYLPLDPSYPAQRLEFMLRDARARAVLTTAALHASVPSGGAAVICLDRSESEAASLPPAPLSVTSSPDQLAYVIYTSGSTGQPKGVGVSHTAAAAHLHSFAETIGLSPVDRLLQFAAPGFDVSLEQMLAPLAAGAAVVLRGDQQWSLAELTQRIVANGVSVLNLPPAYWNQWLHDWLAQGNHQPPAQLRLMIVGGEALPLAAAQIWQTTSLATIRLLNAYGPTETTITATLAEVEAEWSKLDGLSALPIGRPLPGRAAYVLDDALDPVPAGVAGELHLGGLGLARGYLHRPELTASTFIPDPFSSELGARLYKTGDLARFRADGTIEFLGRIDQQVKLRGFRIELGEIEAALMHHEAVREAAVIVRDERLVAYVVSGPHPPAPSPTRAGEGESFGPSPSPAGAGEGAAQPGVRAFQSEGLQSFLASRLPDYMLPSAFVLLDALPRTISGKLDRQALPAPEQRRKHAVIAPRDTIELRLVQLWEELLDLRPIGIHDSFLELGGDSILAVRLMAQIQRLFGQQLPLAALFQDRTIEQLARRLRQQTAPEPDVLVPIQPRGTQRPWFFVHPIGGNVLAYVELARQLGPDQPFYGLQSPGLNDPQRAHTSVEAMAADYIAALRGIQPHGPYQLGGWSFGGVVAFEMARQLQACGEQVAALVLIDSEVPTPPVVIPSEIELLHGFAQDLGLAFELPVAHTDGSAARDEYFRAMLEQAQRSGIMPPEVGAAEMRRLFEMFKTNLLALLAYEPQPYNGSIALFVAAGKHSPRATDPRLAWLDLASERVVVHKLPADHYTLLKAPHVQKIAAEILCSLALDVDAAPIAVLASE